MRSRKQAADVKPATPAVREPHGSAAGHLIPPIDLAQRQVTLTLRAHGVVVADTKPLLTVLEEAVVLWREVQDDASNAVPPGEEVEQARAVAEKCREVASRLQRLAPSVVAAAEGVHWTEHRELFESVKTRALFVLNDLAATFDQAADSLATRPPRTGPIPNPARPMALRMVVAALIRHTNPPIKPARARGVAAELLNTCGVPMPNAPHELRRIERSR